MLGSFAGDVGADGAGYEHTYKVFREKSPEGARAVLWIAEGRQLLAFSQQVQYWHWRHHRLR